MTNEVAEQVLTCQRDLFNLDPGNGFLNGAYMSPQLKSVYAAGRHALQSKNDPTSISTNDFFQTVAEVKSAFAQLIDCPEAERVALIPAVSYGVATVANNLDLVSGDNVVVAAAQFPSNYYSWDEKCQAADAELRVVARPEPGTSLSWSQAIEQAIDERTKILALSTLHWADGTLWDLPALRARTHAVGAWLLIDGTQSIGAMPFSVREIEPDALIAAGYKWLMGPYSTAYAYYGPALDDGRPIEENWINRLNSHDFKNLVHYQTDYRPKAGRYSVGEQSNFLALPMQLAALQQLNHWEPARIQAYCASLWAEIEDDLAALGIMLPAARAQHLVGIRLPAHLHAEGLAEALKIRRLSLSFRGDAIRVAPNVYNRKDEMQRLLDALRAIA